MHKQCKACRELKEAEAFSKASSNKDGLNSTCKPCVVIRNTEYWRTPYGRISQVFNVQKMNSKARGHELPSYTANQLFDWAVSKGLNELIDTWKASGYDKDLVPSVDRLDGTKGYSLDNIRLVTWKENNDAQYADRKSCKVITRQNRKVRQLSLSGELVATHDSIAAAARAVGCVRTNINAMCTGINPHIKSVGGFLWEYAHKEKLTA